MFWHGLNTMAIYACIGDPADTRHKGKQACSQNEGALSQMSGMQERKNAVQ